MGRLVKGMYSDHSQQGLFDLRMGQMRLQNRFIYRGWWFNAKGEKLGLGDLAMQDFIKIRDELQENELFVILSEEDNIVRLIKESDTNQSADIEAPGSEYIAKNAIYIIARGNVYFVPRLGNMKKFINVYGVQMTVLSEEEALEMILAARIREKYLRSR